MVLQGLCLSLGEGEAAMMTGPNGSGKTTAIRMFAGFIKPSAGWLLWEGHSLTNSDVYQLFRTNVHMMGAKEAIKSPLSVRENVQFWAELEGSRERVEASLEIVGLSHLSHLPAAVLSLGQRRRVQLARLLAIPRPLWLLDEPSVGLDSQGVKLLEDMISSHRQQGGMAIIATHTPISVEGATQLHFPKRDPVNGIDSNPLRL